MKMKASKEHAGTHSANDFRSILTGYLPGDEPLFTELGISFADITKESMVMFNILRQGFFATDFKSASSDLVGPAIFMVLFAVVLLLNGRIHFAYLYLLSLTSCISMYLLLKLMTPLNIEFFKVTNILGYSFVPTLLFAIVNLLLPLQRSSRLVVGFFFALWSTYIASTVMVGHFQLKKKQLLIAYPILMIYTCFIITAIV